MKVVAFSRMSRGCALALALGWFCAPVAAQVEEDPAADAPAAESPQAEQDQADSEIARFRDNIRLHFIAGEYGKVLELGEEFRRRFSADEDVSFYMSQAQARLAKANEKVPFTRMRDRRPSSVTPSTVIAPPMSTPRPEATPGAAPDLTAGAVPETGTAPETGVTPAADESGATVPGAGEPTEPSDAGLVAPPETAQPLEAAPPEVEPAVAEPAMPAPPDAPEAEGPVAPGGGLTTTLTNLSGGMAAYAVVGLAVLAFIVAIVMLLRRRKSNRVLEEMEAEQVAVDWPTDTTGAASLEAATAAFEADHATSGEFAGATDYVAGPDEDLSPGEMTSAVPAATAVGSAQAESPEAEEAGVEESFTNDEFWTDQREAEEPKPEESTGGLAEEESADEGLIALADESGESQFDFSSGMESPAPAAVDSGMEDSAIESLGDAPITPEDLQEAAQSSLSQGEPEESEGFRSEATLENLGEAPVAPDAGEAEASDTGRGEGEADSDLPEMGALDLDEKALQDSSGIDLFPDDESSFGLDEASPKDEAAEAQDLFAGEQSGSAIDFGDISAGTSAAGASAAVPPPATDAEADEVREEEQGFDLSGVGGAEEREGGDALAEAPAEDDGSDLPEAMPERELQFGAEPQFGEEVESEIGGLNEDSSFETDLIFSEPGAELSEPTSNELSPLEVEEEEDPFKSVDAEGHHHHGGPATAETDDASTLLVGDLETPETSTKTGMDFTGLGADDGEPETIDSSMAAAEAEDEELSEAEESDFLQAFHDDETVALEADEGDENESIEGPEGRKVTAKDETVSGASGGAASRLSRLQFDPFEKERNLGSDAFESEEWDKAIHHLSIAVALRPEAHEVKDLLRKARRKRKETRTGQES